MDNRPQHKVVKTKKKKKEKKQLQQQQQLEQGQEIGQQQQQDNDDALSSLGTDDDELGHEEYLPIVHVDDDTLPENAEALDTYEYNLPASDALECRASVIAFVINATDVRDECDGLRKAFDKTCSVSSTGTAAAVGAVATSADASVGKVRTHEQQSSHTKKKRRR